MTNRRVRDENNPREMVASFNFTNRQLKKSRSNDLARVVQYFESLEGYFDCSNDFRDHAPFQKLRVIKEYFDIDRKELIFLNIFSKFSDV